jgi:hypothetical protein
VRRRIGDVRSHIDEMPVTARRTCSSGAALVYQNLIQPCPEPRSVPTRWQRTIGADKRVLQSLFGVVPIPQDPQRKAEAQVPIALNQDRERVDIAVHDRGDDFGVWGNHHFHAI